MAGAGYKLFNTGDVLTAAQVNTYLQEQVVMVFANAAARTTALSGVLAEGMVTYLKDTDALEIYSGTAWVGYGSGDITGITTGATSGLTGGVTSGTADLKFNTTAKGGLLVGTGSGTVTELSVGSNNTVLTADSSTASGLKWASAASSDWVQLASTTLSSAAASVDFTSISGSYKHLHVVYQCRSAASASNGTLMSRVNSDSGSNYDWTTSGGTFSGVTEQFAGTYILWSRIAANTAPTGAVGSGVITIPSYAETTFHKTFVSQHGFKIGTSAGDLGVRNNWALWRNTAAITSISFFDGATGGNLMAGSTFTLYGEK